MQARDVNKHAQNSEANQPDNKLKIARISSQVILGAVGLGAGALYFGPAKVCADNLTCGKWLSEAIGRDAAVAIFSATGINFGVINAYFSGKSIERYIHYMAKQSSYWQCAAKSGLILLHIGSQSVSTVNTSLTTSSNLTESIITIGGIIPGIFYGTVGTFEKDIPYLFSQSRGMMRGVAHRLSAYFSEISEEEKIYRARLIHYAKEHQRFLQKTEHHWQAIASHPDKITMANIHDDPLEFLLRFDAEEDRHPTLTAGVHFVGQLLGLAVAANHSIAFLKNTHDSFKEYIPNDALRWLVTALLSSSVTYSNTAVTIRGTTGLLDNAANKLRGKPLNSLMFNLHPARAILALLTCTLLAALSYTVENMLFEHEFPGKDQGVRRGLRLSANASMIFYHIAGMFQFFHLMSSALSRQDREKFIFKLEGAVNQLKSMTFENFLSLVEKNTREQNAALTIKEFDSTKVTTKPVSQASTKKKTLWFSWFKSSTPSEEKQPLLNNVMTSTASI